MSCKSFDGTVPCKRDAVETMFWPGKTTDVCEIHAIGVRRVAEVMGFHVDSRPYVKPEPAAPDDEGALAEAMRDEIRKLAEKYAKHEHLSGFSQELRDVADEIDAVIEDVEGVE